MLDSSQPQGLGIGKRMQFLRQSIKSDGSLSPTQRHILTALFFYSDDLGVCYPSYSELQDFTGLSRPAISKNLKSLEEKKWIRYKKGCARSKKANTYYIEPSKIGIDTRNIVMLSQHTKQDDYENVVYDQRFG